MTVTAAITTLLLPLGVWLVIASAPSQVQLDDNRTASSGLLAFLIATVVFAAFGFAFIFGNINTGLLGTANPFNLRNSLNAVLPTPQPWSIVGLHGFLFQGVPFAGLSLFLPFLALAQTCAVLVNSLIAHRSHALTQVALAAASGGVAFGVAGHWIFGGGWLAMLGQNLGYGHGTIDMGGMATVGLIAGAFALAFVITQPHTVASPPLAPSLASARSTNSVRTVSGALLILMGAIAVVASNPLLGVQADRVALSYAITLLAASTAAGVFAVAYTVFTSAQHKADITLAAHAMLAAVIAVSSGGGLLPVWTAILLGLLIGGLSTLGLYWFQTQLHRRAAPVDSATSALLVHIFVPALISFMVAGLLANGAWGAGLNGVGADGYLGLAHLGISGLVPLREGMSDAGQLTAQVCGVLAVTLFAVGLAVGLIRLLRISLANNAVYEAAINTPAYDRPQEAMAAGALAVWTRTLPSGVGAELHVASISPQMHSPNLLGSPVSLVETHTPLEPTPISDVLAPLVEAEPSGQLPSPQAASDGLDTSGLSRPPRARPFVVELAEENPAAEEGLVERMRKLRRSRQPAQPVRARKIAYPTRVAGRRLIRPLVEDNTPKP